MKFSPLRQRIRDYEDAYRIKLPKRTPVIIRVDGKAFHTLTRGLRRPWDSRFIECMNWAAESLCREIQGAQLAYVQSDEITVFVRNYDKFSTSPWFDNNLQKMCSVSAGIAASAFNTRVLTTIYSIPSAVFDSRVFAVPREEVANVFIDRQIDCIRNSKLSLGQHVIGKKKIHGMDQNDITEALLRDHNVNWDKENSWHKYGRVVCKEPVGKAEGFHLAWLIMKETPVFKDDREMIDKLVWPKNEEGQYSTYKEKENPQSAALTPNGQVIECECKFQRDKKFMLKTKDILPPKEETKE